jgi:hypothetical protein
MRGRRAWIELAVYDQTAMLDTEIDAAILAIATDKMQDSVLMEWPEMKPADTKKTISFWVQNRVYVKAGGNTQVETYYCPLRYRCKCKIQLRITRSPASVFLDWSGGPHTFELYHSEETCKFLSVRQRIAVAKLARSNPQASGTEVRRALHTSYIQVHTHYVHHICITYELHIQHTIYIMIWFKYAPYPLHMMIHMQLSVYI